MSAIPAISLSGMTAARMALGASAHNIANASTAAFRRDQVALGTAQGGGVTASLTQAGHEGHALEADVVGQLMAKNHFLANLTVFKTHDQMMGSLLAIAG